MYIYMKKGKTKLEEFNKGKTKLYMKKPDKKEDKRTKMLARS